MRLDLPALSPQRERVAAESGRVREAKKLLPSALVLAGAISIWWALAESRIAGRQLLATPWETLAALPSGWRPLTEHLLATLGRSAAGLAIGAVLGALLGVGASVLLPRAPITEALLDLCRSIPPVVLYPLFLIAFGYNELARIGTVALACSWTLALAVTTASRAPRSVRRELLELSGASRLEILRWTQPWEALGALAVGLRAAASLAVIVAVVTEMLVGAGHGIGSDVVSAQISGDHLSLTLDLVAIGFTGWVLNRALRSLEDRARRLDG